MHSHTRSRNGNPMLHLPKTPKVPTTDDIDRHGKQQRNYPPRTASFLSLVAGLEGAQENKGQSLLVTHNKASWILRRWPSFRDFQAKEKLILSLCSRVVLLCRSLFADCDCAAWHLSQIDPSVLQQGQWNFLAGHLVLLWSM